MSVQYLNNYRGIAILLVVLGHAMSAIPGAVPPYIHFFAPIFGSGTLLFVLVAGIFFSTLTKEQNYPSFMGNKIKFVVLPYIFLSFPAAMVYVLGWKNTHDWMDVAWLHSLNPVLAYAYLMATGAHLGPLWFVPMILLYYVASPIWWTLIRRKLLLPAVAFSLVLGMFLGRPTGNSNFLQSAFYFLAPYLLGIYAGENPNLIKSLAPFAGKGFLACIALLLAIGDITFAGLHWMLLGSLATACMLIALCLSKLNHKIKWLDLFARLSFYIFFVHGYIVGACRMYWSKSAFYGSEIPIVAGIFLATLAISIAAYIPLKLTLKARSRFFLAA